MTTDKNAQYMEALERAERRAELDDIFLLDPVASRQAKEDEATLRELRERMATEGIAIAEMEARKDAAYLERNQVVAALAKAFPSGVAKTAIEGWSEDWHGCVYIDLPTGQVSWHYHDSQSYLFDDLPQYAGKWDGHDTDEKYRRVAALKAQPAHGAVPAPISHEVVIGDDGKVFVEREAAHMYVKPVAQGAVPVAETTFNGIGLRWLSADVREATPLGTKLYAHQTPPADVVRDAPEGFVLVPVEPTPGMVRAAWGTDVSNDDNNVKRVWAAMLAASKENKP